MKPLVREVIIVEGKHDISAVRHAVDALVVTTTGTRLSADRLRHLTTLSNRMGAIIFTDPDGPGERIRTRLSDALPEAKHARLSPRQTRSSSGGSLGIAHAKPQDILKALKKAGATFISTTPHYQPSHLSTWRLAGCPGAAERRKRFCAALGMAPLDAQSLCRCLNACDFTEAEIRMALAQTEQE